MADTQYYLVVTDLGKTLIDEAYNNSTKVNIIEMALGDSGGLYVKPDSSFTQLVSEFGREDIHDDLGGDDGLIHVISKVTAKNAGQTVREFGLYDDLGNMIVYGAYPESLVPEVDSAEFMQLEIEAMVYLDNASAVTISVNPIYQYASEDEAGIIKLIKESEMTGEDESKADDSKALTLFKLLKRKATEKLIGLSRFSTKDEAVAGTSTSTMLNPKTGLDLVKSRISSSTSEKRNDYAISELVASEIKTTAEDAKNTASNAMPKNSNENDNFNWKGKASTMPAAYYHHTFSDSNRKVYVYFYPEDETESYNSLVYFRVRDGLSYQELVYDGTNLNLSGIGNVYHPKNPQQYVELAGRATDADNATSAYNATNAINAENALNANTADKVNNTNIGSFSSAFTIVPNQAWYGYPSPIGRSQMVSYASHGLPIASDGFLMKVGGRDTLGGSSWLFISDYSGANSKLYFGCSVSADKPVNWKRCYTTDDPQPTDGLGYNQSYYSTKSTGDKNIVREANVLYTNNTARPIYVNIAGYISNGSNTKHAFLVDGNIAYERTSNNDSQSNISAIVPPGSTYKIDNPAYTIVSWSELR